MSEPVCVQGVSPVAAVEIEDISRCIGGPGAFVSEGELSVASLLRGILDSLALFTA